MSPTITRLLAPNPGPFTGPGTNTYVITSHDECVVIDPGPVIDRHRLAILEELEPLQPKAIIVTHTHVDHAPLANPLAASLDVPAYGHAPGPQFDPDRRLADGDKISFGSVTLEVLHTPGHADDHCCFLLDDVLFTGDHIKGGSSVMVEDMSPYLRSLDRLRPLALSRLYPGHGEVMDDPQAVISQYVEHRLDRERQIVAAIIEGAGSVGEVVEAVYADVEPALHPLAAYSVVAHLRKLREERKLTFDSSEVTGFDDHGARWRLRITWHQEGQ